MASEHETLTVKEIGVMLRVHPSTIYRLIRQGKIPGFRIGKRWRFHQAREHPLFSQVNEVHGDSSRGVANQEVQALLNEAAGAVECATGGHGRCVVSKCRCLCHHSPARAIEPAHEQLGSPASTSDR
jgi:excisionase family DNA binding protein